MANAAVFILDNQKSSVEFTWSYGGLSDETGTVKTLHGTVHLNEDVPEQSDVSVTMDARSLKTEDTSTEELLKSEDFFNTAKYPTITFSSDAISRLDDDKDQMTGHLTLHGITKPVTLDVQFSKDELENVRAHRATVMTLHAAATINRSEFGMDDYSGFVADPVTIAITAHLKKAPDPKKPIAATH